MRSILSRRLPVLAVLAALAFGPTLQAQQAPTPEQRLASELIRSALHHAGAMPLTSHGLDIACMLGSEAVALDPDSAGLWRLVLGVATLAERDNLRAQAIERLAALDPADETVRLHRLNLALDRCRTVEERDAAYQRLLEPENVQRIGPAAASRLALDLALLKQRTGETDAFSRWLTRALELDRSNRPAAALAAGFFQANVDDPVGQAELLVNLVLTDPTEVQTQVMLAQHLLEHGAYHAATRIYAIAASGLKAARMRTSTEFMADFAVAQWAAGDAAASLETIDRRQGEIDEIYRAQQARTNRTLTMMQISELKGPVNPTLAAVAAVIHAGRSDSEAAAASAKAAIEAAEKQIASAGAATPPPDSAEMATQHLQTAWLALWLGDDAAKAAEHVAEAEKLQPLTDQARQRFDGWQALKKGEIDKASRTALAAGTEQRRGWSRSGTGARTSRPDEGRRQGAARHQQGPAGHDDRHLGIRATGSPAWPPSAADPGGHRTRAAGRVDCRNVRSILDRLIDSCDASRDTGQRESRRV